VRQTAKLQTINRKYYQWTCSKCYMKTDKTFSAFFSLCYEFCFCNNFTLKLLKCQE